MASTSAPESTLPLKQVSYNGIDYEVVKEGLAEILNPVQAEQAEESNNKGKSPAQSVFYNPIQQFNRDLSVLAIHVFADQKIQAYEQKQEKRKDIGPNKRRKLNGSEHAKEVVNDGASSKEIATESRVDQEMPDAPAQDVTGKPDGSMAGQTNDAPRKGPQNPTIRVLDALSASGLRALRYAQEIPSITRIVANDLSLSATKAIDVNIKHNKQEPKIELNTGDAINFMYNSKGRFEVVDLDPYGTAGPFLDAAVQAITNGGLLCVTCTDSAVFASAGYCEKTFSMYGGLPVKGAHSHEGGLRLLLHAIATSAARYGLAIEPLLSLSIDFYIRVFVKVRKSAQEVKYLGSKTMIVYGCDSGCGAWTTQPLARAKENLDKNDTLYHTFQLAQAPSVDSKCRHCGFTMHLSGPMWAGPIQNPYFVQNMLDKLETLPLETYGTKPRMEGMLITARDETLVSTSKPIGDEPQTRLPAQLVDHHPFFFLPSIISGILHCQAPSSAQLRGALLRLGYRVTRSHAKPGSIRTDAPWEVIWEVMREWIRQKRPVKESNIKVGSAAYPILQKRREHRDLLADVRDELRVLSESKATEKGDVRVKLESLLYRLDHDQSNGVAAGVGVEGVEENHEKATEKELPLHKLKIVFDEELGRKSEENEGARGKKLVRYQINPRANWGPMSRAKG